MTPTSSDLFSTLAAILGTTPDIIHDEDAPELWSVWLEDDLLGAGWGG